MLRSFSFMRRNGDGLMWQPELNPHATGEFSNAVVQANSSLEDFTYAGVYDGHGEPETTRFIRNQFFQNLHTNFVDRFTIQTEEISSYSSRHTNDDVSIGDDLGLVDALTETVDRQTSIERPSPRLSEQALGCLTVEFFHRQEKINTSSRYLNECSICLESFTEGEVLTCLPCGHRYHCCCIDPWVRTCGDCPYCRTSIDVKQTSECLNSDITM